MKKPARKKRTRTIDLRGLTSEERRIGALVHIGMGTYMVVEIKERIAVLEPESKP